MDKIKTLSALAFFVVLISSAAHAQEFQIDTQASGPVTVCGGAITFSVELTKLTSDTVENIKLTPQMPEGMVYITGSAQGMTEIIPLNPADPSFSINDFAPGEITVTFQARANCILIETLRSTGSSSNLVNNNTKLEYRIGGVDEDIPEPNGSESYSVLFAELELFVPENEKNQGAPFINKVMNRHITVKNSGLGSITTVDFFLKTEPELTLDKLELQTSAGYQVITSVLTTPLGRKYTITDFSGVGDGDAYFEESEDIHLTDYVKANTSKGSIETIYTAQWGCDNAICDPEDSQASFAAYVEAIGGKPVINSRWVTTRYTDYCNAPPAIVKYIFLNEGSENLPATRDAAFNLKWGIPLNGYNTTNDFHFFIVRSDNSKFNIDHLLSYTENLFVTNGIPSGHKMYNFSFTDEFSSDPDGPGGMDDVDEDGFYDDLAVGATVNIEAHLKLTFTDLFAKGSSFVSSGSRFNYHEWSGEQGGINWSFPLYNIFISDLDMTGPADLVDGNIGAFKFILDAQTTNLIHHYNNATFELDIRIPQGVKLTTLKWQNQVLPFTQVGTQVKIFHPLTRLPSDLELNFDLQLDCSSGPVPGSDTLQFSLYHYSDYDCPNSRFRIATIKKAVTLHCGSCANTETTQFAAERKTLGWVLPSFPKTHYQFGELYGASSTIPKVAPNTPGIRLDAAYPKDEVELSVQGRVAAAASNLQAEIKYTAPFALETLHLFSATFEVNGNVYPFPVEYIPSKVVQDSTYAYTYTIPLGSPGWPVDLAPGTVFQLKAKAYVDELPSIKQGEYRLGNFRGRFYSMVNGAPTDCAGFGDDFNVLRPLHQNPSGISVGNVLDSTNLIHVTFTGSQWSNRSDPLGIRDFPGEFRPLSYLDAVTVTLPPGYIFDTTKPVRFNVDFGQLVNYGLEGVNFSPDKRTITIQSSNNIPLGNLTSAFYGYVQTDCSNPENVFIPVTTQDDFRTYSYDYNYKIYPYLSSPADHALRSGTHNVILMNARRPALELTANSIQEGYSDKVTWPVQLCNPVAGSFYKAKSRNTWVAFELQSDDSSTMLEGALDQDDNPLQVIFYGPKDADHPNGRNMMVSLGNMDISACIQLKAIASYKNCEEDKLQNINIYSSWDYHAYPEVVGYNGSITDREPSCEGNTLTEVMTVKYKTADLQWEVRKNGAAEVDLCVATPFEIDLASTKYGDMKNLKVWLQLPDYATLDPANPPQFHYPYNADPRPFPADAFLSQDGKTGFEIAKLIGGNLPGIRLSDNKIKLTFHITTSCGFDPGLPIRYTVEGNTNCNDLISFADQRKIKLNGFSPAELDSLELTLSAPPALTCNSSNEIFLTIKNAGDSTSRINQLEVTLPEGTAFTEMLTGDLPPPLVAVVNNQVKLRWTLPDDYLAPDSTKSLSFSTYLNQTAPGTSAVLIIARTFKTLDAFCTESDETCATRATTGLSELSVPVTGLASLDITYGHFICAYQFLAFINQVGDCSIAQYNWNFGDGRTSIEPMPFHAFDTPGTYNVSVSVNFNCGGCSGTQSKQIQLVVTPPGAILKDTLIEVLTEQKKQVLQVAASTFSDSWPTQHINPDLNELHSFVNGTLGVWRNEGVYVYEAPRSVSDQIDISKDGTFKLDHFNWQYSDFDAIPGWIKANSMTQYSPFSYELENKDVLGIYSSALYDYGGHLPSAHGVNMRNAEMAFTSFEFLDGKASGNWIFANETVPSYFLYNINTGFGNIAVVEATLKQLEDIDTVDITSRQLAIQSLMSRSGYTQDNEIICKQVYSVNSQWSVIVLKHAPSAGLWTGRMKVKNDFAPAVSAVIDSTFAHSGSSSLKVNTEKVFKQGLLQLDSGKNYLVSTWVSVKNISVSTPKLANNLGVDIVTRSRQGQVLATVSFSPSGQVIEGWQQIKGTFTFSGGRDASVELKFKPGSTGTAWYDDLRLHPEKGNMKSYVYDLKDYRLRAILDEENFASFYFYDAEGNLYLVKKETEAGIKTISENVSSLIESN